MPNDPFDPYTFNLEAMLDRVDAEIGLATGERAELREFMLVVNDDGADGNVQLATLVLAAMTKLHDDMRSKIGWGLLWFAQELSRRILLVLT